MLIDIYKHEWVSFTAKQFMWVCVRPERSSVNRPRGDQRRPLNTTSTHNTIQEQHHTHKFLLDIFPSTLRLFSLWQRLATGGSGKDVYTETPRRSESSHPSGPDDGWGVWMTDGGFGWRHPLTHPSTDRTSVLFQGKHNCRDKKTLIFCKFGQSWTLTTLKFRAAITFFFSITVFFLYHN